MARQEAIDRGGDPTEIEELGDGFVGKYAFRAVFPTPEPAVRFEAQMREYGLSAWRRLEPSAVLSWVGAHASVHVAGMYSGGMLSRGFIERLDESHLRIVPPGGEPTEGDIVLIHDVVDIELLAYPRQTSADATPGESA